MARSGDIALWRLIVAATIAWRARYRNRRRQRCIVGDSPRLPEWSWCGVRHEYRQDGRRCGRTHHICSALTLATFDCRSSVAGSLAVGSIPASHGLQWNDDCIIRCECDAKQMIQSLFTLCAVGYLVIYAFEGAIRYGLYNVGLDNAILLRDVLITVPLTLLFVCRAFRVPHPSGFLRLRLHYRAARYDRGAEPADDRSGDLRCQTANQCLFGFIAASVRRRRENRARPVCADLAVHPWRRNIGQIHLHVSLDGLGISLSRDSGDVPLVGYR